jgi:hypothetical protein
LANEIGALVVALGGFVGVSVLAQLTSLAQVRLHTALSIGANMKEEMAD